MELLPGILSFRWLFAVMTRKRNRKKREIRGNFKNGKRVKLQRQTGK
jgi:hypothetical protein